ncbi:MAG TPA: efflux RND transporter permease subunit, partial [Sphingopyxis sp.]|nr:efflux RND transporter permease subunit [Sphingopyxis sp.]
MIEKLIAASIRFRWSVIVATLIVAAFGIAQLLKLPIDAVPDITNKQVQINTAAPDLGPVDIERLVTFPVETAMAGIPGLTGSRSISRNGFSQVTLVFSDGTDLYFARQQVAERLNQAKGALPDDAEPAMGPVSTGLGEVLMYVVDFAPRTAAAKGRAAGTPGFQPDGSYLTPAGERLTDEVARQG